MHLLKVEVLDKEAIRPLGNPFGVKSLWEDYAGEYALQVGTGIALSLPGDFKLDITSLFPDIIILGYRFALNNELVISAWYNGSVSQHCKGKEFAKVYVVQRGVVPVRFVETKDDSEDCECPTYQ